MTHPHALAAQAALHSLREAHGWLLATIEAEAGGATAPRPTGPLTARAAQLRDAGLRAERAERLTAARYGLADTTAGLGASPMPIRPELLDAQALAATAVAEAASLMEQALDAHPAFDAHPTLRSAPGGWWTTTAWMLTVLPYVGHWTAQATARAARIADRSIRQAVGEGASHEPYEARCPACDGYSLVTETAAPPDHRTVLCDLTDCRCTGDECPCGVDERLPGLPHRWPLTSAPALPSEQTIEEGAAA